MVDSDKVSDKEQTKQQSLTPSLLQGKGKKSKEEVLKRYWKNDGKRVWVTKKAARDEKEQEAKAEKKKEDEKKKQEAEKKTHKDCDIIL